MADTQNWQSGQQRRSQAHLAKLQLQEAVFSPMLLHEQLTLKHAKTETGTAGAGCNGCEFVLTLYKLHDKFEGPDLGQVPVIQCDPRFNARCQQVVND